MIRTAILAACILLAQLSSAAELLPNVLPCGRPGEAGGLAAGTDLTRVTVDNRRYPNAICNDGTPAVFYVSRYTREEDRNKWVIFLQGGGGCGDGQPCAQRWCSIETNFGMDKMTSSLSKPSIRGNGILRREERNRFAGWNHVLLFYCTSDNWSGTNTTTLQATTNGGMPVEFLIHFKGFFVVDAVIDILRTSRNRAVRTGAPVAVALPDLDEATEILLAGSSAGAGGVIFNTDRLQTLLRSKNVLCQNGSTCPLVFKAAIDATYQANLTDADFARSNLCQQDPRGCSVARFYTANYERSVKTVQGAQRDDTCVSWHKANAPATEYLCAEGNHILENHLTTPFFVRQDLQDSLLTGNFVEAGFGTSADFGMRVERQLLELPTIDSRAEEGSVVSGGPRLATPATFGPQCQDHESFTNQQAFFDAKVQGLSFHDVLWNWWGGAQPQQVVRDFVQPGPAPGCP